MVASMAYIHFTAVNVAMSFTMIGSISITCTASI